MPRPSPSSPWQGVQKIRNRSWPRSSTARSTGNGSVSASLPAVLPVVNSSSDHVPLIPRIAARNRARRPAAAPTCRHRRNRWPHTARSAAGRTSRCGSRAERQGQARTSAGQPRVPPSRRAARSDHARSLYLGSFSAHLALEASFRRGTTEIALGSCSSRKRRALSGSNNGSRACRQRKNRLRDARAKLGTLKTG